MLPNTLQGCSTFPEEVPSNAAIAIDESVPAVALAGIEEAPTGAAARGNAVEVGVTAAEIGKVGMVTGIASKDAGRPKDGAVAAAAKRKRCSCVSTSVAIYTCAPVLFAARNRNSDTRGGKLAAASCYAPVFCFYRRCLCSLLLLPAASSLCCSQCCLKQPTTAPCCCLLLLSQAAATARCRYNSPSW